MTIVLPLSPFFHAISTRLSVATLAGCCLLVVGGAQPASAQGRSVDLGYEFVRYSSGGVSTNAAKGVAGDLSLHLKGRLSVIGFIDWSSGKSSETAFSITEDATTTFLTFGGGGRIALGRGPGLRTFIQLAGGAARRSVSTKVTGPFLDTTVEQSKIDPLVQAGLGATIPIGSRFRAIGEGDFRRIFTQNDATTGIRAFVGLQLGL